MTIPTETPTEVLGGEGDVCAGCGAPLATDQRYCLNCGLRRAEARLPFADMIRDRPETAAAAAAVPPPRTPPPTALVAGAGAVLAALLIGLGALIGAVGADKELRTIQPASTPAPKPPNIVVNAGTGGEATSETLTSDWPEGKTGWTVQLQEFENTTPVSEVEAAKSDAESKGAKDVGALNSDDFGSLEPGLYIVYSGEFLGKGGKKKANAALKKLRKDFREAKVIKVGGVAGGAATGARSSKTVGKDQIRDLTQAATQEEQQKKSARLPDELGIEGKPPPKDKKKPGGGGGGGITIP
jgi:hypothetical protein